MNPFLAQGLAIVIKELLRQFPGLTFLAIEKQLELLGEGALEAVKEWWATEMPDKPWPEMEPQENPGQPYDPGQL